MGLPIKKEDRKYSYADYLEWPNDERWELIDGVAYDMSPAPNRRHQWLVGEVFVKIHNILKDQPCEVYISPFDVRMSEMPEATNNEIFNVVQPDVSVYCRGDQLDDAGAVTAPDIAVEVLSPFTSVKDQREKLRLYERFCVAEYWIIDPANETLSVYSTIKESGQVTMPCLYGKPEIFGASDIYISRVLPDFSLKLEELFTQL